jgi:hypothetical protein
MMHGFVARLAFPGCVQKAIFNVLFQILCLVDNVQPAGASEPVGTIESITLKHFSLIEYGLMWIRSIVVLRYASTLVMLVSEQCV